MIPLGPTTFTVQAKTTSTARTRPYSREIDVKPPRKRRKHGVFQDPRYPQGVWPGITASDERLNHEHMDG